MPPLSLADALAAFDDAWSPRTVATVNDYDVRVFKAKGEFTRHRHRDSDELFLVLEGTLTIRMDDDEVTLKPGQLYVVARGVSHQPVSEHGASVLLLEPSEVVNTGDAPGPLTSPRRVR